MLGGRLAVTAAVAVACFLQAPGRVVPETKLDLVVDPAGFLGRALHLWDAEAGFGRIGNQAAGYLLPMGPFHLAGDAIGVPAWAVQRAWFALLVCTALWGALRLLDVLAVGTAGTRLLGATAYAVAPSFTAVVAFQSGGQLPHALLPWAVVPLATGAAAAAPRRAAARSGVAVALMGAVNGAATAVVLVAPAIFVATREPGPRRRRLAGWWLLAVAAATAWWVVPLAVQVAYGFDFTAYTETAATTTTTTAAVEVLRGTANWLGHLAVPSGRWLPGAWAVVAEPAAVAAGVTVVAVGLAGLAHRDVPERWWLALCAGVAAAGMAAGYAGPAGGPLAGLVRDALDGPAAPLRNVTKLAPVLALPLAAGLAHGAAVGLRRVRALASPSPSPSSSAVARHGGAALAAGLAAAVAVTAMPLLTGRLAAPGSFDGIPGYWVAAADWLGDHADGTVSLVVPSASFGEYRWGRPLDEPLQALARSPWAVRDLVPLGGAGSTRLMDAVGRLVDTGTPSPGLAAVLARSGVGHVVVRNDLDRARTGAPPPAAVARALEGSGLSPATAFGPVVGRGLSAGRLDPALGPGATGRRAVEVWRVDAGVGGVAPVAARSGPLAVAGGPDSLVPLADRGLLAGPVLLGGPGRPVVSDAPARRHVDFGVVRGGAGPVLPAGAPAADLDVEGEAATVADVEGGDVVASSAALPETAARAAVDGDPASAWVPAGGVGEWLELRFPERVVSSVTVRPSPGRGADPARVTSVLVDTAAGRAVARLDGDGPVDVDAPRGPTGWVRVTVAGVEGAGFGVDGAGLAEVGVPGVALRPVLVTPRPPGSPGDGPAAYVLDRRRADPYDAARADEETALHRRLTVVAPSSYEVLAGVVGVPGQALDALVGRSAEGDVSVSASSTWRGLPAFGPWAAADGDLSTSWVAEPGDDEPALTLRWEGERTVDRLEVVAAGAPASPVATVVVEAGGSRQEVAVGADGSVDLDPVTTDAVVVGVPAATGRMVALAEVRVPALDGLTMAVPDPAAAVTVACGDGPVVLVDGDAVRLSVDGTVGDLVALRPLAAAPCDGPVRLDAGDHAVDTDPGGPLSVTGLALVPEGWPDAGGGDGERVVAVASWGGESRSFDVGPGGEAVLGSTDNANRGWRATLGGRTLTPVVVDGWRQGWWLPAGDGGTVAVEMVPARWYRWGLLVGAVLLAGLAVAAAAPPWASAPRRTARRSGPADEPGAAGPAVATGTPGPAAEPAPPTTAATGPPGTPAGPPTGTPGATAGSPIRPGAATGGPPGTPRATPGATAPPATGAATGSPTGTPDPAPGATAPPATGAASGSPTGTPDPAPGATAPPATDAATGSPTGTPGALRPLGAAPARAGALALAGAVAFLVGGPLVLAVPLLLVLPARDRSLPVVAAACMVGAGLAVVLDPGVPPGAGVGSFGATAQILAGLALVATLTAAVPATWRPSLPGRRP